MKQLMIYSIDDAFTKAKSTYPRSAKLGNSRWILVDAVVASFRTSDREGMLVLQEHRKGCVTPYNHWGFMVKHSVCQVCLALRREEELAVCDQCGKAGCLNCRYTLGSTITCLECVEKNTAR